jgi:hypothetical protein
MTSIAGTTALETLFLIAFSIASYNHQTLVTILHNITSSIPAINSEHLVSKETPLQATARNQATKHGCQIEWNA